MKWQDVRKQYPDTWLLIEALEAHTTEEKRPHNSTYPKGGVSSSKDSFVVHQTLVFQIKFCSKSPALRVAAKR